MTEKSGHKNGDDRFDLVLYGATGFTGRLVAEYLMEQRTSLRFALAGRSRARLEEVRAALATIDPAAAALPIVVGDSLDAAAMDAIAKQSRVVCSTVGPYALYGSALVAACAAHGTAYCDLTGEPDWVRAMIDAHHDRAVETAARIVTCCGFDSIPSDLGVFLLHEHVARRGKKLAAAHLRVRDIKGGPSGGTIATVLSLAERINDPAVKRVLGDPYALNPEGARTGPDARDQMGVRRDSPSGRWTAPFVMASINARVVRRSNALLDFAYGSDFRYDEAMDMGAGPKGFFRAVGLGAGLGLFFGAAALRPTRALLRRFLPAPGEGPGAVARASGSFRIAIDGVTTDGEHFRAWVCADRDPGYGATAIMLGESARCLAEDTLPPRGGILTPAASMGMKLIERLRRAGMKFEVEG